MNDVDIFIELVKRLTDDIVGWEDPEIHPGIHRKNRELATAKAFKQAVIAHEHLTKEP